MPDPTALQDSPDCAEVDPVVLAQRPDDRAPLPAVDGTEPGSGDDAGEPLRQRAEAAARDPLAERPVAQPLLVGRS